MRAGLGRSNFMDVSGSFQRWGNGDKRYLSSVTGISVISTSHIPWEGRAGVSPVCRGGLHSKTRDWGVLPLELIPLDTDEFWVLLCMSLCSLNSPVMLSGWKATPCLPHNCTPTTFVTSSSKWHQCWMPLGCVPSFLRLQQWRCSSTTQRPHRYSGEEGRRRN